MLEMNEKLGSTKFAPTLDWTLRAERKAERKAFAAALEALACGHHRRRHTVSTVQGQINGF